MKKRYWFGAVVLLLVGILIWWVLPGTPHESQSGTNTNAADKDLQAFYQVLEADYPEVYERLAYDPDHERLWVTTTDKSSASKISAISLKDLEVDDFAKTGQPIAFSQDIDLAVVEKSSYMAYHDQSLYVGYFDKENLGHVGYFALNDQGLPVHEGDEKDLYQPNAVYDTPEQIQGLAFLGDQLVLSQSYGNKDSKLLYFDFGDKDRLNNLTADQAVAELVTPAYMQQILAEGDFLYLFFESSATQYRLNPTVTSIDRVIKIKK